ncbi:MAG TPA: glutathione S-transferase family protein [Steroidobacteraceae bacterium]|nr:glutathione S-transferase family protein [Steroidobacteraceae bacterium]
MAYELYYWPTIPGRGEFVRLALEESAVEYVDVARRSGADAGVQALMRLLAQAGPHPPFAPPVLRAGKLLIAQTANILAYLGAHHGLAPADEAGRVWTNQLQLTVADLVDEVHDTHHPIASALYYEEQRTEAARRSEHFLASRLPKYLGYFERVLEQAPAPGAYLAGGSLTYADLSVFQAVDGLEYAFPRAMSRESPRYPRLTALCERVRTRPRIAAYLASPRRLQYGEQGIFRHYPELDPA